VPVPAKVLNASTYFPLNAILNLSVSKAVVICELICDVWNFISTCHIAPNAAIKVGLPVLAVFKVPLLLLHYSNLRQFAVCISCL
jgi:hypothetical protein